MDIIKLVVKSKYYNMRTCDYEVGIYHENVLLDYQQLNDIIGRCSYTMVNDTVSTNGIYFRIVDFRSPDCKMVDDHIFKIKGMLGIRFIGDSTNDTRPLKISHSEALLNLSGKHSVLTSDYIKLYPSDTTIIKISNLNNKGIYIGDFEFTIEASLKRSINDIIIPIGILISGFYMLNKLSRLLG